MLHANERVVFHELFHELFFVAHHGTDLHCCSTSQSQLCANVSSECVVVWYSVLQYVAVCCSGAASCNVVQHVAVWCSVVQHNAV